MGLVSKHIEQVSEATENDERAELKEDPFEREKICASDKIQEFKRNREICSGNQEITNFLCLKYALNAPRTITITITSMKFNLTSEYRDEIKGQKQETNTQCS